MFLHDARRWSGACLVLLLAGCVSDQASNGAGSGELGRGSLYVNCDANDAACDASIQRLAEGTPIAVGASLTMSYEGHVPNAPTGEPTTMVLFSASPPMLSGDATEFVAWLPGRVAVIARTQEGTVTDFVHLALEAVSDIQVASDAGDVLLVGEQGVWSAIPRSEDGRVLGGQLGYAWEVEGTAVELIEQTNRSATITAREPGSAILRARTGDVVGESTVVVEEAP
ncbi:MAG: hypothetical protein ACOC1F_02315 [Myxococcota bacterium]